MMNTFKATISSIESSNGAMLVGMQCVFGTLYSLIIEPCEFELGDEILAIFKDNEVLVAQDLPESMLNVFNGKVISNDSKGFLSALAVESSPDSKHIDATANVIYALLAKTSKDLKPNAPCKWHIPCHHILLEKSIRA